MDCVLLGDGVISVVEFKRSKLGAAEREQVLGPWTLGKVLGLLTLPAFFYALAWSVAEGGEAG